MNSPVAVPVFSGRGHRSALGWFLLLFFQALLQGMHLGAAELPAKPSAAVPSDASPSVVWAPRFESRIESLITAAAAKDATEMPLEIQEETKIFRFDATSGSWKPTGERTSTTLEINDLSAEDYRIQYHPVVHMWFPSAESDMDQMRLIAHEEIRSKVGTRRMRHHISTALGDDPAHKTNRVEILPFEEARELKWQWHTFLNFTFWGMERSSGRSLASEIIGPWWTKRQVEETDDALSLMLDDHYNTVHLVLDKKMGYAVRLCDRTVRGGEAGDMVLKCEILEHERVAEGVYLPKSAIFTRWQKGLPTRKIEYRMISLRHLEQPVALDLIVPEGATVLDRTVKQDAQKPTR
ncbi:MAG: hypothetical protein ACAH88_18150 [Roseimicrobium sp.]